MNIELLNIDCMEYMAGLPDKAFDLAIVDPPYGSQNIIGGYTSGKGGGLAKQKDYHKELWAQKPPTLLYFNEIVRVSKNQIIWGANHYADLLPFNCSGWIFWDKDNGDVSFSDGELAWSSFNRGLRKMVYRWSGMIQQDMKNKEERIHPTQKPVALYKWLLTHYAKEGNRILDTHLGSGSSAIAAHKMGFDFVGCELDKDYYAAACKRFKEQTMQQSMF